MTDIIKLPYSVFSHEKYTDLIDMIESMGYEWSKEYPNDLRDNVGECVGCMYQGMTDSVCDVCLPPSWQHYEKRK